MSILHGVIMFTMIFILVFIAGGMIKMKTRFRTIQAFALGLGAGIVHASAPAVPAAVAMFYLLIMLCFMIYMAALWSYNGSTVKEMIVFILTDVLFMWTGMASADRILDLTSYKWVIGFITALPKVALILSIGFFIYDRISFREKLMDGEIDPDGFLGVEDDEEDEDPVSLFEKLRRWVKDEENSDDYHYGIAGDFARDC